MTQLALFNIRHILRAAAANSFLSSLRLRPLLLLALYVLTINGPIVLSPRSTKSRGRFDATQVASKNQKELLDTARRLAQSNNPVDHDHLRKLLTSAQFLKQLDGTERYQGAPDRLLLSEVLRELSANRASSAEAVLIALTHSPSFLANPLRVELLIRACVPLRPAPALVVRFWDTHWLPDDGYSHVTAVAVCDNGSTPALALLERKMASRGHSDDDKRVWMVTGVMMHRNEEAMLETCERLLRGMLPQRLRPLLVEALFDYRPMEWFRPATVLVPPDRKLASAAARARLHSIGEYALKSVRLSEQQQQVVQAVLKEI